VARPETWKVSLNSTASAEMVWTIRIVKDGRHVVHAVDELHAALVVTQIFLRHGIAVEGIDGSDGLQLGPDAIEEFCGGDQRAGQWRRDRLKFTFGLNRIARPS